jgi:hypothetical protein
MVRKKQTHPYHGTKEFIDTIENTVPLLATFMLPPFDYQFLNDGEFDRLLGGAHKPVKEMSNEELRYTLRQLGLKIRGKREVLINRLLSAQSFYKQCGTVFKQAHRDLEEHSEMEQDEKPVVSPTNPGSADATPNHSSEEMEEEEEEEYDSSVNSKYALMKVMDLIAELRRRGLQTIGRKEELVERLMILDKQEGKLQKKKDKASRKGTAVGP